MVKKFASKNRTCYLLSVDGVRILLLPNPQFITTFVYFHQVVTSILSLGIKTVKQLQPVAREKHVMLHVTCSTSVFQKATMEVIARTSCAKIWS